MTVGAARDYRSADGFFLPDEAVDLGGIRWLAAGDRFCLVEVDSRMELGSNLRAIELANRLLDERIEGLVETLPMFVSVLVHYDSGTLAPKRLQDRIAGIWKEIASEDDIAIPSRVIEVPACYSDPWTRACVENYSRTIKPIGDDAAYVAEVSGLANAEAFARRHAFTLHWVGGVGFWPGLPDMMPLDPRCRHSIPKYDPPRLSTVTGAIGVGGGFTSIYPMDTPGGYHLVGRTPVPIFSMDTRQPQFRDKATLFEPGDRVKFVQIDASTFEEIEQAVAAAAYRYTIGDGEIFRLSDYRAWADAAAASDEPLPW